MDDVDAAVEELFLSGRENEVVKGNACRVKS